jgi:hypothetical protein
MTQEHIGANPRKYGVSPSRWIDLPIGIVVEQRFAQCPKPSFGRWESQVERVVGNNAKIHIGANPGKYGVSPKRWIDLPIRITSLTNHLSIFKVWTTLLCIYENWTSIETSATSSTFGTDQGKQLVVITKLISPIRGWTCV